MLTFDTDYLALHHAGAQHSGIAWCHANKYSIGDLIRVLVLLHGVLSAGELENHLENL